MTSTAKRLIREREILPRLTLPVAGTGSDGHGKTVTLTGQQTSLLVFVHAGCGSCESYLDELAGSLEDLQSWATRLVAVTKGPDAPDGLPFPVVVDHDSTARRRIGIGEDEAAVILADPWGEVNEVVTIGSDHGFPLPSQLVESAKIVDLGCGECNVPGPEWVDAE